MRVSVEEPVEQCVMLGLLLCVRVTEGQCETVAEVQADRDTEGDLDGDSESVGDSDGV